MADALHVGTSNPRAFAFFVAGLFAQRAGETVTAAALYAEAIGVDAMYHKAINNRGLMLLRAGMQAYAEEREPVAARRHFANAAQLFTHARDIDGTVAEYSYNLGTALSYAGRVELRAGNTERAAALQEASIDAYREALARLEPRAAQAPERPGIAKTLAGFWRSARPDTTEREAFCVAVELGLATSRALLRAIRHDERRADDETRALHHADAAQRAMPAIRHDLGLMYNLACYFVVSGELERAAQIFEALRALHPGIAALARTDPDLIDEPEIMALFPEPMAARPTVGPAGMPSAPRTGAGGPASLIDSM